MISVSDLSMEYPVPLRIREWARAIIHPRTRVFALKDINLTIGNGERVAFLGPNGAGKSTLLRIMAGLLYPTAGMVEIGGLSTVRDNAQIRKRVGLVLNEDRSFFWRLTGEENLAFFGALEDMRGPDLKRKIRELMEAVGLGKAMASRVATYSSGMRQRLAIARGLLSDPEVLILDEPTRTLDPAGALKVWELLSGDSAFLRKRTVLIATHKFEEAEALCSRFFLIGGGAVAGAGDSRELKKADVTLKTLYMEKIGAFAN